MNLMRDRLIELISKAREECLSMSCFQCEYQGKRVPKGCVSRLIADHLLADGVIAPPCKVGDEVWFINCLDEIVYIGKIHDVRYNGQSCIYRIVRNIENGGVFAFSDYEIGKSVFLDRKEAEQVLKGE